MPKYYRFRATSPTRRPRKCKDKERDIETEKTNSNMERNWLDLTLACASAPSWYLRRTSWRETPPLIGFPRHLVAGLRASLQLNNRPIIVVKIPPNICFCQDCLESMSRLSN